MNLLPKNTALGILKITEIHDFYDGPKLFCAKNSSNNLYLVYWCDQRDDSAEGWLYLPISEGRLETVRCGNLSLRDAFLFPDDGGLYHVYTVPDAINDIAVYHQVGKILAPLFPPEGDFISYHDIEFIEDDIEEENEVYNAEWNHQLKIRKESRRTFPSSEAVTSVLYLWTDIIQSIMSSFRRNQTIYPVMAKPGSFEIKFNTQHSDIGNDALLLLNNIINSKDTIIEKLYAAEVEPYKLKELFEITAKYKLNIEITTKDEIGNNESINISHNESSEWISILEPHALSVLGTDKIPQANDIEKVITILEYKQEGTFITPALIDVTSDRQVLYYMGACYTLGLLTKNGFLTSQGRLLLSKEGDERYIVLADRFESSDFGWAWISWSNVKSMIELDPKTAVDFLKAVVPGLSKDTGKRRATTLIKWLAVLSPYHRNYQD